DGRIVEIVRRLDELPVNVHLSSDLVAFTLPRAHFTSFSGIPVLEVIQKPLTGWRIVVKNIEDKIIATVLIMLLSPVLALTALVVRLDSPGPVLFCQPRHGFNNQVLHVYKFRSMYHNRPSEEETPQATRDDPRVTRVGAFIRRTSLDELPQLFNVLEGTMSLVGPRPHAVSHNRFYGELIERYFARHKVKPGITGWAQINGLRGETETQDKMQARVEYDIYYIDNWSLWFDLKIIVKTAKVVLFQETAY
ncbi:MAG: sugar transferase, partial [Rhodospirillaceae bacterium]